LLLVAGSFFVFTEFLAGISSVGGLFLPEIIALLDEISDLTIIIFFGLATYLLYKSDLTEITHLRYSADTDQMTGLHNHSFFRRTASRRLGLARTYNLPLTCLMIDIDNFKDYNDSYGHEAGNYALQCVAQVIQEFSRVDDLVARYGGEEFVMIIVGETEWAVTVAERIRSAIETNCTPERERSLSRPLTISVGVVPLSKQIKALDDLVRAADEQMYRTKMTGKNQVAY
jgi:diguanylate cyclase (GGDEF)-like protein